MEPHISLITLGVSNLERAVTFYRDGLGLPMREGDSGVAFFRLRDLWLALFPREALAEDAGVSSVGRGFTGITLAHNVRTDKEVDALLEQAVAAGGLLVKAGSPAFWGGYSGYFADPDGHLWEVAANPEML
ncbi:MAG: VOC family protein [Deinococcota bacterium]|nr:VOC family protein [Deinococcota bacterium]